MQALISIISQKPGLSSREIAREYLVPTPTYLPLYVRQKLEIQMQLDRLVERGKIDRIDSKYYPKPTLKCA